MARTTAPYGLEVKIEYNGLTLNDKSDYDAYVIERIGGLNDADIRYTSTPHPARHGEQASPSWYAGRTITLEGTIRARTVPKLREMQYALRAAIGASMTDRALIFRTNITTADVYCFARKSDSLQMAEEQLNMLPSRRFLATFRSSDPRFLAVIGATAIISGPTSGNISGITNFGNFQEYPIIRFTGPLSGATVYSPVTGISINLTRAVPAGETWELDTYRRTFTVGVTNVYYALNPASDMITLEPGGNLLGYAATGATITSKISLFYRSAWI